MMNRAGKTASGGIAAALAVIVLLFNGYTYPRLQFILPMAAGFIIYTLSFLVGKKYAVFAYMSSTILALILCASKVPVIYFALFFGYYPMLNELSERLPGKIPGAAARIVFFNIIAAGVLYLCRLLFRVDILKDGMYGIQTPWMIAVVLNIAFVMYDLTVYFYRKEYRRMITDFVKKQISNKK